MRRRDPVAVVMRPNVLMPLMLYLACSIVILGFAQKILGGHRPPLLRCATVGALYEAVNELMTRNSPRKLGGEPARTAKREPDRAKPQKKSEQAGRFSCRYWQVREPPRPPLRSGTPLLP